MMSVFIKNVFHRTEGNVNGVKRVSGASRLETLRVFKTLRVSRADPVFLFFSLQALRLCGKFFISDKVCF